MSPIFVTAVVWFLLGFGFHAALIWYNNRQKRRWHAGMDVLLRRVSMEQRKRHNNERVLEAVREVTRDRQDVAWKN